MNKCVLQLKVTIDKASGTKLFQLILWCFHTSGRKDV